MAEPVNLNRARKARAKAAERTQAAENRVRFGRPKAQTETERLEADRARRELDGRRRED